MALAIREPDTRAGRHPSSFSGVKDMGYLFGKLIWYVAIAFVVGLAVGWATCSRVEDGQG